MPCVWISLDAMDVSGELHLDVEHSVFKQRLNAHGEALTHFEPLKHDVGPSKHGNGTNTEGKGDSGECQTCYGAESEDFPCCNTCSEVRSAYQAKGWAISNLESIEQCKHEGYQEEVFAQDGEGCRMYGELLINKVRIVFSKVLDLLLTYFLTTSII